MALPLYVRGTLGVDASALGLLWGALGVGAFIGASLVNQLRDLPQRHVLIAITGCGRCARSSSPQPGR